MSTHAAPVHGHRVSFNPWLAAVVLLGAAVIALGAWVVIDSIRGGDSATKDATALIDNFNAAAVANDGAKARTMMTPATKPPCRRARLIFVDISNGYAEPSLLTKK